MIRRAEAMTVSLPQLIVSVPLFFVLFFGIGFILNMILKTTWFPVIAYTGLLIFFIVSKGGLMIVDMIIMFSGLVGAFVSGWAIKTLRVKGYRMF
jgi:hypothetical protein